MAALGRAQSRALRPYLASLRAIGLSTGWLRGAQLIEQGLPVVWGAVLGLLIAVTPPIVFATSVPGYLLSIPWTSMLVLLASLLLATVRAALNSVRGTRLRGASSWASVSGGQSSPSAPPETSAGVHTRVALTRARSG